MALYGAVLASNAESCVASGWVDAASQPGAKDRYIGLRETYDGAVERAKMCLPKAARADWASHVTMFRASFSAAAWLQATVAWNSEACLPALYKKTYKDGTDWGVWHFTCPLPLDYVDPATGVPLLTVVFGPMPRTSAAPCGDGPVPPALPLSGVWASRAEFRAAPAPPPLPALPWAGGEPPAVGVRPNKRPRRSEA